MAAPADDADEKACDIDCECKQVARRSEPAGSRARAQSMLNLNVQDKAARDRSRDDRPAKRPRAAEYRPEQRAGERMRDREPGVAGGARRAQPNGR